jgi:hypothetical protein
MSNRYKRAARTAAELHLGDFKPLDEAIPELARLLTAEPATAKTHPFTDETSAVDNRNLAAENDPKRRIVSGIVSNSEPEAPDAPESDVENLMISASSPSRTRTGTSSRTRDFKSPASAIPPWGLSALSTASVASRVRPAHVYIVNYPHGQSPVKLF